MIDCSVQFSQSLSRVRLFATPWTSVCQVSLSIMNSRSLLKLMSIELVIDLYNSTGKNGIIELSSVQSLSCVRLFVTPWTATWLQIHISIEEKERITEGSTNPGGKRHTHNSEDKTSSHDDYSQALKLNEIFSDGF